MLDKFIQLIQLGAGDFEHFDAKQIYLLDNVRCLLKAWAANEVLQKAGLYHLAHSPLDELNDEARHHLSEQRAALASLLSPEVEILIYYFHVCDYQRLFDEPKDKKNVTIYDRYLQQHTQVNERLLSQVCELATAVALGQLSNQKKELDCITPFLQQMEEKMHPYLSRGAKNRLNQIPKCV